MAFSRILIGLALLVLLGAWANYSCPYPDLAEILANPKKFAGQRVAIFIEARIVEQTEDGFILMQRGKRLRVHCEVKEAPVGEYVAVAGIFDPPDHLRADGLRLARDRRWKMSISVVPLLLLIILLPLALRFDHQTRTFTLRTSTYA
ncbi:MAG: hypothetical protein ONB44_11655 [candidate division KSB1 bacterium]|nr:hypothetical protein [candidate division KSB1 bacterium]MDZ7302780.1 hypothetical protein [candidate division KSB1 bacterium]MDZ7310055.1 hypothetical protein [candidate division KSB1 bacterium]